jgi:hypothetical protein
MYAEQWLDRAFGMDRVDIFALEADDAKRLDRQNDYDVLATLVDHYVTAGGTVRISAAHAKIKHKADHSLQILCIKGCYSREAT